MASMDILELTAHPERLNGDTLYELRLLIARYPYFQTLRLLYLKNLYLLHDASFGAELRKAVLYVTDRRRLFHWIEGESPAPAPRPVAVAEPEEKVEVKEDRTLSLINDFLLTLPAEEVPPMQQLDYTTDYVASLLTEEVPAAPVSAPAPEAPAPEPSAPAPEAGTDDLDDSYFTETLAKIYIRQQRYEKALEIIRKLNLKYPKKNAYFADQIRFLEKLIINNNSNK